MFKRLVILCIVSIFSVHHAQAALKVVPLQDTMLEQRAKDLSLELRCLVCQNQSIESSDADLAVDLKILLREQIMQGKTDLEIKQFLVDRYGEFVLLQPLFTSQTSFLWLTPIIFLALAFLSAYIYFRNMNKAQKDESDDQ